MKKALLLLILIGSITFLFPSALFAAPKVVLNNQNISFDVPPTIENNRTLVPLRVIFEALGADVQWDGSSQTVIAKKDTTEIKLIIGGNAFKNAKLVPIDVPAKIINQRTMVPLRFVSESLGCQVAWEPSSQTITIASSNDTVKAPENEDKQLSMSYMMGNNVKVGYNFNLELLNIAAAHSANFNHKTYVSYNSNINTLAKDYFKNYPKKDYENDLYRLSNDGIINKFTHGETNVMLAYDKNLDTALYSFNTNRSFSSDGMLRNYQDEIKILKDFNSHTDAENYFLQNQKAYQEAIDTFKTKVNFNHISRIEDVLGIKLDKASFNIILSPSEGGGTATTLRDTKGTLVYFNITNPTEPFEHSLMVLYHEDIHNFLYHIFEKDRSKYANTNFEKVLKKEVGSSNAFNETITRALSFLVLEQYHKDIDTNRLMTQELRNGWVNTDKVYELIKKEYIGDRDKYKTIEDFMPRILEYLKELEKYPVTSPADQVKYGIKLNKDTVLFIFGSKSFCDNIKLDLPYYKVGRNASLSYFEESIFNNKNNLAVISASYNFDEMPQKIKAAVSEDAYCSIKQGEYLTINVEGINVVFIN